MDKELARLQVLMKDAHELAPGIMQGTIGANTVVMCGSGIGKVNAALSAQRLILACRPDCIISTGVAGGLDSSLRPKQVVASSEVVYHDVWCGEPNQWGQVQGMPARFRVGETFQPTKRSSRRLNNLVLGFLRISSAMLDGGMSRPSSWCT